MVPTCAAVASPPKKPYPPSKPTLAPVRPAAMAAATPAAPPPTTSTSQGMVAARIGQSLLLFLAPHVAAVIVEVFPLSFRVEPKDHLMRPAHHRPSPVRRRTPLGTPSRDEVELLDSALPQRGRDVVGGLEQILVGRQRAFPHSQLGQFRALVDAQAIRRKYAVGRRALIQKCLRFLDVGPRLARAAEQHRDQERQAGIARPTQFESAFVQRVY